MVPSVHSLLHCMDSLSSTRTPSYTWVHSHIATIFAPLPGLGSGVAGGAGASWQLGSFTAAACAKRCPSASGPCLARSRPLPVQHRQGAVGYANQLCIAAGLETVSVCLRRGLLARGCRWGRRRLAAGDVATHAVRSGRKYKPPSAPAPCDCSPNSHLPANAGRHHTTLIPTAAS